jgi:chromosome segregation ATPase
MAASLIRALAFLAATSAAVAVSPIEKVTQLIKDLHTEVSTEGKAEAKTYDQFACFCKSKSTSTSASITTGADTIDQRSADIQVKTETVAKKGKEKQDTKVKLETLSRTLEETKTRCDSEKQTYEASDADLSKAIASLEGAQSTLTDSRSTSLVVVKAKVEKNLELAEAMKLIDAPKRFQALSLLQKVDPADPDYKFHSQGIVDLLARLEEEFRARKAEADAEWEKTSTACKNTKRDLNSDIGNAKNAISTLTQDIGTLETGIGAARGDVVKAEAQLKDDQLYLKDLTVLCEERAKDWDQRSAQRAGELEALTKCLGVLESKVANADSVNKRALLIESKAAQVSADPEDDTDASDAADPAEPSDLPEADAPSFLQTGRISKLRGSSALSEEAKMQVRANKALSFLRQESSRLDSTALAAVSSRSGDPFDKVKKLIQGLVERLLNEATEEATKKGFCDTEMAKATQDVQFRNAQLQKLNAEMQSLDAKKDSLTQEIDDLSDDLKDLAKDLKEATAIREKEKGENIKLIQEAKEGKAAVAEAILIMKSFYGKAARASLIQTGESPVDADAPAAAEGSYKGKQDSANGILGLLEVIESDFDRTVRKTTESESAAHSEFTDFAQASKADLAGKTTKKKLDQQDLETTTSTLESKMEDFKDTMKMLDETMKTMEELKPTCIDTGMSFEERVAKREAEITALKKALCILDENNVESLCTSA